ncbi:DEAD/DEAH box helicase [Bacillus shivajii]|nr:DEAD/DEAH box helicase [Bacillus shivajii]
MLLDELPFSLAEVYEHVRNGWVRYEPGVVKEGSTYQCQRCGNRDPAMFGQFNCFRCKTTCHYCRSCIMMGRVTTCTPLFTWQTPHNTPSSDTHHKMKWEGTLSIFQQKASNELCETIKSYWATEKNEPDEFLMWAVCGAGKTEMLFHGIELALNKGLRVLIATPRTDVVLELEPRIQEAFPDTDVRAFYGGVKDRFAQGELVISTTHQLLRFYHAFDLVIIDEVDAFPYTADEKLKYAVRHARKPQSLCVYVTATPDPKMKKFAEAGRLKTAKVARRYHRHPLPVPTFQWIGSWKKKLGAGKLPGQVISWVKKHGEAKKQMFLFVPSVNVMNEVVEVLKEAVDFNVDGVHSADEDRRQKVMKFRDGKTQVLVTTTILERGVTVKGVQVAVLGAEEAIFTESALVQIAGRVGRSPDEPNGDVVYFHYGKTKEMIKAVEHIKEMNRLGEEELEGAPVTE